MGNITFERLTAIFDSDTTRFKRGADEVLKIVDSLEKRLKSVNLSFGSNGSSKSLVNETKEILKLQTAIAAQIKAVEKATKSAIQTNAELIKQDRERLRIIQQINSKSNPSNNPVRPSSSGGDGGGFSAVFGGNIAANLISQTTSLLTDGARAVLNYSSGLEQARIGFTSMTGSAALANQHLKELEEFARKTPFEFSELVTASRKLQGVGIEAKKVIPILTDVGNSLAAAGRISEIPAAAKAIGDIAAKGKLAGQEIIQLANAGIPAWEALAKATGKTQAEIVKLSEAGKISSKIFLEALHQYSQERFGDAMLQQSKTFEGAMSNVKDILLQTASKSFEPFYQKISEFTVRFAADLEKQNYNSISEILSKKLGEAVGLSVKEVAKQGASDFGSQFKKDISDILSGNYDFGKAVERDLPALAGIYEGLFGGKGITGYLDDQFGAGAFKKEVAEMEKAQKAFRDNMGTGVQMGDGRFFLDPKTNTLKRIIEVSDAVKATPSLAEQLDIKTAAEIAKDLKSTLESNLSALNDSKRIAEANLNNRQQYTFDDQMSGIQSKLALDKGYIQKEIALQSKFFNDQLKAYADDAEKTAEITREKNSRIGKLNTDLRVGEINAAKQIADVERRILETRRDAQIAFKQILVKEKTFDVGVGGFNVERDIANQIIDASSGYNQLIQLTRDSYFEVGRVISESYALQLSNQSLTDEQRLNLMRQNGLEQKELAEKNRREILDIEQKRFEASAKMVTQHYSQLQSLSKFQQQAFSSLTENFFGGGESSLRNIEETNRKLLDFTAGFKEMKRTMADYKKEELNLTKQIFGDDVKSVIGDALIPSTEIGEKLKQVKNSIAALAPEIENALAVNPQLPLYEKIIEINNDLFLGQKQINAETVDALKMRLLAETQIQRIREINLQIAEKEALIKQARDSGQPGQMIPLQNEVNDLKRQKLNIGFESGASQVKLASELIAGLKKDLEDLAKGDAAKIAGLDNKAQIGILQTQKGYYQEIANLKAYIANLDASSQKEIEIAALQDIVALRQLETEKIIEGNRTLEYRLRVQMAQMPSFSEMFKNNTADLPNAMGDLLGNIAQQWDGTWRGLFDSVKRGFAQMLSDMAQEYLKASFSKLIGSLIGSLAGMFGGGGGGGFGSNASAITGIHESIHLATGGLVAGRGTSTSDSIPANLSNGEFVQQAKAVEFYGVDFMNALNNLQIPKRGYSVGGLVTDSIGGAAAYDIPVMPKAEMFGAGSVNNKTANSEKNITINNTVNQVFKTPRSLTAPKSTRQQADAAIGGMVRGSRNYD